jgi:ATP-binding cassette subfamily C protein LapB
LHDVVVRHGDRVLATAITAEIEAGGCLGITGPDGAGKSSLMRMIMGESGDSAGIEVDGRPVREATLSRGRGGLVYVDRNPVIFDGTIRDNLSLFGDADETDRALDVARRIGLEEDVHRLPMGYDTPLAEASMLTRGWLQRIALARALALQPRMLILNDANTSLDHAADAAILRELAGLRGSTTLVLATGRPSWIAIADHVVDLTGQTARDIRQWDADRGGDAIDAGSRSAAPGHLPPRARISA